MHVRTILSFNHFRSIKFGIYGTRSRVPRSKNDQRSYEHGRLGSLAEYSFIVTFLHGSDGRSCRDRNCSRSVQTLDDNRSSRSVSHRFAAGCIFNIKVHINSRKLHKFKEICVSDSDKIHERTTSRHKS